MSSLVTIFQKRLGVSRAEATWRMAGFLLLVTAMVAVIASVVTFFPYKSRMVEQIPLLPGSHSLVKSILDGEALVERDPFVALAEGKTILVAPNGETVSYMVKVDGISYRYDEEAGYDTFRYKVTDTQLQNDGILVRELRRDKTSMAMVFFVVPIAALIVVLTLLFIAQSKIHSHLVGDARYRSVWVG